MAIGHSITINDEKETGYTALDPVPLLKYLSSKGRPTTDVEKCNRFILPAGKEYGRGWILMRGTDVKEIYDATTNDSYGEDGTKKPRWNSFGHSIRFAPIGVEANNQEKKGILIKRLGISNVQSVTGWNEDYMKDGANLGLSEHFVIVEFVDIRYAVRMMKFAGRHLNSLTASFYGDTWASPDQFNVRAYDVLKPDWTPAYVTGTLKPELGEDGYPIENSRIPWTWQEIVDEIAKSLPEYDFRATNPSEGEPKALNSDNVVFPTEDPQNLRFIGMGVWDALCEILHQTGNTIWRDFNGSWYIESYQYKDNEKGFLKKEESYHKWLRDPGWILPRNPIETPNISIPNKLLICFPSTLVDYELALENFYVTYDRTGNGVEHTKFYKVEKDLNPLAYPETYTTLYSSTYADYDELGNLKNSTTLQSIADDMLLAFKAAKGWETKALQHTYNYYQDILCGSSVSAVQWSCSTSGATTEILINPLKYVPKNGSVSLLGGHQEEILAWENFSLPDVIRKHDPVTRFIVCKTLEDIRPGERGLAAIQSGNFNTASPYNGNNPIAWGQGDLGVSEDNLQNYREDPNGSGVVLYLHQLSGRNPIRKDTKVLAFFHTQVKRWIAVYIPCVTSFSESTLWADMCPNEDGWIFPSKDLCTCTNEECGSGSTSPIVSEGKILIAKNPYKLSGKKGRKVLLLHTSCGNQLPIGSGYSGDINYDIQDSCIIIQVEHEAKELAVNSAWTGTLSCSGTASYAFKAPVQEFSVMTCKDSFTYDTAITLYSHEVLTDWFVEGETIKGTKVDMITFGICNERDVVLHVGTSCAYGSG